MDYVEAPKYPDEENPFLALPQNRNDRESYIIYRGKLVYLMLNRFPYNAGHLLAIPFREVDDLADLSPEEKLELMETICLAERLLRRVLKPDGFNIGFNLGTAAGASVTRHLHCHIVPRWAGDTNFMPVIADSRVLPTSLEGMWEGLRAACDAETSS
jgi:ATP adenylyltransferase